MAVLNPDELPIVPHAFCGDEDCCGCLIAVEHGDVADLICNECDVVVFSSVPVGEVEQRLVRIAMSQGVCSAICPHCQALNTFPGFSAIMAYICKECGERVGVKTPIQ